MLHVHKHATYVATDTSRGFVLLFSRRRLRVLDRAPVKVMQDDRGETEMRRHCNAPKS